MTKDQDKLIADLLVWAGGERGNYIFRRDLRFYYALLKQREIEIINQKPVRGYDNEVEGNSNTSV